MAPPDMPGVLVIAVSGRISYEEAPQFREEILHEVNASDNVKLVVDLQGIHKMDTAGVAVLLESLIVGQERGRRLLLCAPSESVIKIFRLAGLRDALDSCCSGLEEVQKKLMG